MFAVAKRWYYTSLSVHDFILVQNVPIDTHWERDIFRAAYSFFEVILLHRTNMLIAHISIIRSSRLENALKFESRVFFQTVYMNRGRA